MLNLYISSINSLFLCSSFNDKPIDAEAVGPMGRDLFEREQNDLLNDLKDIPKKACDRRVCSQFCFISNCTLCFPRSGD